SLEQWGYEVLQLAYHGYFFLAGIFLFRLHRDMNAIKRYAWVYLGAAQIVFVVFAMMIASQMDDTYATADEPPYRIGLAVSASLFCWLMIWGLTGLGLTVLARPSRRVRWLSDASYWVYLVHLPVVGLMMIAIRDWPIGPWSKFALVVVAASVTTLASYQYVVRYGWIGRWLNGPRSRRSAMS
ncbi:MAG: acyltransferase family protein, partial [Phycisphaeraceae bacterium]